jgi:TRAP-type C4-dicarboxylate transport system substrate-binding protein
VKPLTRVVVAVGLAALLAAGCSSGTKSGGTAKHEITLVMQTPDAPDVDAEYFIAQVKARTGGRVRIAEGTDYGSANPDNEARLVRALRSGTATMAYIPSRAWERASSVHAFRALQAPFLVTDYAVLRQITTGPIGHSMLRSLGRIGVVGLGLVPDELRRAFGRRPLASPTAFRGARIRVVTSPTSVLALRSIGAVPLTNFTSSELGGALRSGRLDGAELSTIAITNNRYVPDAHYLTANLALFAKTQTIAILKSVFDRLSAADQAALREAASAAVAHANPAAQERNEVEQLCSQGLRLVQASPSDLASLRQAAASAYPILDRDAVTRKEIRAIERLGGQAAEAPAALPACASNRRHQPGSSSNGLAGTYVMSASKSEVASAAGSHTPNGDNWGSFRLVLGNRRFRVSDRRAAGELAQGVSRASSGSTSGTYALHGDRIVFTPENGVGDSPLGASGDPPIVCRWSLYRNELTFRQLPPKAQASATHGLDGGGPPLLYVQPWRRIA